MRPAKFIDSMSEQHEDKGKSATYELGYHLVPSLSEDDLALRVDELKQAVVGAGGKIVADQAPQSFVLSYTMKRLRGGSYDKYDTSFFGWLRFEAVTEGIDELREGLEKNEHLVRHLLFKLDQAALKPQPAPVRRPQEVTERKTLERKQEVEEKGEVSEKELDKQIEQLIA
jgi:ribosomal protein S6